MTRSRSQGEIVRFFKRTAVERIDRVGIERFIAHLSQREICASTVKAYMVVLKKVLTTALHQEWIDRLPTFPQVKTQANPRGAFHRRGISHAIAISQAPTARLPRAPGQGTHTSQHQGGYLYSHCRRAMGVRVVDWIYCQQLHSPRGFQDHTAQACRDRAR